MLVNFNKYHQIEKPNIYLAYPNKNIICPLPAFDRQADLYFNNISEFEFKLYKYLNGNEIEHYNDITVGKYILVDTPKKLWFRITSLSEDGDGQNCSLTVSMASLETNLGQTLLTALGQMNDELDDQGGLDYYKLYDDSDKKHSIMHIFLSANPMWSIKYIDPDITKEPRSFSQDCISSYDFLVGDVSDSFECIFQFDSEDYTVSIYKLENLGKQTDIYLSYRNLIKHTNVSWSIDDIKTVFYVTGGEDLGGTELTVADVSPSGNNAISNFSYFYNDMSKELVDNLIVYNKKIEENQPLYQQAILDLQALYDELGILQSNVPEELESDDLTLFGLAELKAKQKKYDEARSLYVNYASFEEYQNQGTSLEYENYIKYNDLYNKVTSEIHNRENQIESKNTEIQNKIDLARSLIVNLQDFLGDELYKELSLFVREDTFIDDSFIVTEQMTSSDAINMKKELLLHARKKLDQVCYPQFNMTVDSINFPVIFKYKQWTEQLELGNIITIERDGIVVSARLLKIHFNWDDLTDFSLTFSSKTSLEDGVFEFNEVRDMAQNASTSLDLKSTSWNQASINAKEFKWFTMQEFLDASIQGIVNSDNQDIIIDNTGLKAKYYNEKTDSYSGEQLWLTNSQIVMSDDNFNTAKVAIGRVEIKGKELWGVAAEAIFGKVVWGENIIMENKNNTITMNENGFVATASNGYKLTINPDVPTEIFSIYNGNTAILGVDAQNGKFVFKGTLESTDGHIGGWTIGATGLTSGEVGMSSTNNIAFWAGSTTPSSAEFRVTKAGVLTATDANITGTVTSNNVTITGGSLNIGNGKFIVTNAGIMTAVDGTFSGKITSNEGTIAGWTLTKNSSGNPYLLGNDYSLIEGGTIKIGESNKLDENRYMLYANKSKLNIGDFDVFKYNGRYIFQSYDEFTGISPGGIGSGKALWAAYINDASVSDENMKYGFAVSQSGNTWIRNAIINTATINNMTFESLTVTSLTADYVDAYNPDHKKWSYFYDIELGKSWWDGWTITDVCNDLWDEVFNSSDITLKTNIMDIDSDEALEFILNTRPTTFQFKADGKWSTGFMAQEVDALQDKLDIYYPLTSVDARTGKYLIKYTNYIPLLVSSIQNLQCQVDELKIALDSLNGSTN